LFCFQHLVVPNRIAMGVPEFVMSCAKRCCVGVWFGVGLWGFRV
jgi:hypothetical protein